MLLIERFWATLTCVMSWLTLSPIETTTQQPLSTDFTAAGHSHIPLIPAVEEQPGPIFYPPTGRVAGDGSDFECDYSAMTGYEQCSNPEDRGCWLFNKETQSEYGIYTNYEQTWPTGVLRKYWMKAVYHEFNADGIVFEEGKLFSLWNETTKEWMEPRFPGPYIQACWGDNVSITVYNEMNATESTPGNGTSVHWHGIRQLNSTHSDGVSGVTQCPIAPNGNSYVYNFTATQYGTSWYHSHYSVQYADGLAGLMVLHGPSSSGYDEARDPLYMTDWGHDTAYQTIYTNNLDRASLLLNGRGDVRKFGYTPTAPKDQYPPDGVPPPYEVYFDPPDERGPKRYLLRLINAAFGAQLTFSIDNHLLQVITADFVPIEPYYVRSISIAIGQRYNVIVEANQSHVGDGNFWIRVSTSPICSFGIATPTGYDETGILRYDRTSQSLPGKESVRWPNIDENSCIDEYESLVPIVPWYVGPSINNQDGELDIGYAPSNDKNDFPLATFTFSPFEDKWGLQVDFNNPTFLFLNKTNNPWKPQFVVLPENYTKTDWVYMRLFGFSGHPIHLHGHDFAILQNDGLEQTVACPTNPALRCNNPPRRDVVSVNSLETIIAFKADNPGPWLIHCHIAFHAARGLGLQVLERQEDAAAKWPPDNPFTQQIQEGCDAWTKWWEPSGNRQDDSGI